jgi:MinD superfamily P-loop ATPase
MQDKGVLMISKNRCVGCGICENHCPTGAIRVDKAIGIAVISDDKCSQCRVCMENCPQDAIRNIVEELTVGIGTDDSKTIKADDHVGMSRYFQIWKYSQGRLVFIEQRQNEKYKEDETRIHGDPGKAKATASALKGVNVLVGKMMGPNIERLKNQFVPVIIRETLIEKANEIIRANIIEIIEEKEKSARKGIILT